MSSQHLLEKEKDTDVGSNFHPSSPVGDVEIMEDEYDANHEEMMMWENEKYEELIPDEEMKEHTATPWTTEIAPQ